MTSHLDSINATEEEKRLLPVQDDVCEQEIVIQQSPKKGTSWFASVFMIVNAALGAGLLHFPQAYHNAGGVLIAILIQALFVVFVVIALLVLAHCSDINGAATYQDVLRSVCGQNAQRASAVFLAVYCFGTCITFLIIIGDQWEEFFLFVAKSYFCDKQPWYMDRKATITITSVILILPLCFPKRIDFLKYVSFVGVLGILYVVVLVTVKYFLPHDTPGPIKTKPDAWMDVFQVVPTICFAYQCHVSAIPIYSCMKPRNIRQFSKTVSMAMLVCVIAYTGTAAFGYLTFGDQITSDILLSYDPDVGVILAVIFIAVKIYTTYPILLFCGRAAFECLWTDLRGLAKRHIYTGERKRHIVITLIWFVATLVLAVFIPNIGIVIGMLGALAAVFIFVFPGMLLLVTTREQARSLGVWSTRQRVIVGLSCCFITVGAFIFGLTLTQSLITLSQGVKPDKSKYNC